MSATDSPRLSFGLAVGSALLRGRLSLPGGHHAPAGHSVSEALFGVGVAAAADPAVDAYITERLRETGVRHVRLDFAPGDEAGAQARLLAHLLAAGLHVTLHLVQPREQARRMPGAAEADWRRFVAATLDRYGKSVEIIELGSTTNRQRWAGHTVAGFLAMWEIGWQEARQRGLTIAGPSVTDFEPVWNVGLLHLLALRGQLPDLHSDNLFAERSTEPERFDHKVLGRRLIALGKYNLIKKARLLARIGADYGVPRLFSPAAFWTLPRIERRLPNGEEKQADYLMRYLLLCAASGSLERAWWGPLICHREGLIDNGVRPYPQLERITHYASVEGECADLRARPALAALRQVIAMLSGARYEGRLNTAAGLEMHAFRTPDRLVHAVWTINGRAAALAELYSADDFAAARLFDRDGTELADVARRIVGEAPHYLVWEATRSVTVLPTATLLCDVAIAWHRATERKLQHYYFRDGDWRGIVLARSTAELDHFITQLHPARLVTPSKAGALRHARNAIWSVPDPCASDRRLVIKQPVRLHPHKRLLDRWKPSKGLRSWNGTCELMRHNIAAAPPVAWFERIGDDSLLDNYYICEHVAAPYTARDMMSAFAEGEHHFAGVEELTAYRQLASFLIRMHGGGIQFRDLSGGNILIDPAVDGELGFSLIDTGRIRIQEERLNLRQRFDDLVRVCNKLHWDGRKEFLKIYLTAMHRRLRWWHRVPFYLYDFKVAAKRRVGRKALRRLLGRDRS
ncbi:MAG: hypothetical protein L6Q60_00280 [Rhodocyclaceae bacterium]|nr:hypothetical protein [Rhodocyclaceae bacterium]